MKNILDLVQHGPVLDYQPKEWIPIVGKNTYVLNFRNLQHFKHTMSKLTLKSNSFEQVSYEECVSDLMQGKGLIEPKEYELIKSKVKENLIAKRLISKDIYQGFEYTTEGDTIDVARFASGNPECCIKPKYKGKVDFYELNINTAVLESVSEKTIKDRIARILATVELLEQKRIYIKINAITYSTDVSYSSKFDKHDVCVVVPVFSHKEPKDITKMSSVLNSRFHRKFTFAIRESIYGNNIDSGYGCSGALPKTINIKDNLDECVLAESIINQFITKCKKR